MSRVYYFIPYAFARVIEAYEFSSSIGLSSLDTLLALILPWLELMLGVFLIIGTFIDEAINIIIGLLLFFIIMLFQAHLKGLDISCGCTAGESSLGEAIIRDFALLFASLKKCSCFSAFVYGIQLKSNS